MGSKQKVAYFYDADVGKYYYGQGHPMKPHRVKMAHSLILHYGLYSQMEAYTPLPASEEALTAFHSADYISFLRHVTPDNQEHFAEQSARCNVGEDCPVFEGLYNFCTKYTGGSIGGAVILNYGTNDTVINWAGGLHHGKRSEASGFCYVNDIVLAILELLKYHQRVLYVDIDVHHGDGVEEAFLTTNRVMTCSFHKYGDSFFPGTGDVSEVGKEMGEGYAVNVPLKDGIDDTTYRELFRPIISKIMEVYQPEAVVFQCGADSLAGDKLGVFNISIAGHADCLKFVKSFGLPMLVLGGGGYKISNVARCWAYETGTVLGVELEDRLPANEYLEYYGPDFRLQPPVPKDKPNTNSPEYLEELKMRILANVSSLDAAPGVQFHERAPDAMDEDDFYVNEDAVIEKERASERAEWVGDAAPRGEMEPLRAAPRHQSASAGANGTSRADPQPQQQQLPTASGAAQQQGSAAAAVLAGGPSGAPRLSAQDLQPMANGSEQQRKLPD